VQSENDYQSGMAKSGPKPEKAFTEAVKCEHCGNRAPMEVVASYVQNQYKFIEEPREAHLESTDNYQLLLCPACHRVMLRMFVWDDWSDPEDVVMKTLYPASNRIPLGLPSSIKKDYEAALQVRAISPNAYGVLIGRVIDLVCEDRKAKGRMLGEKLADLAAKGEIPEKLVRVAMSLKEARTQILES
jgi:hypothetical protein